MSEGEGESEGGRQGEGEDGSGRWRLSYDEVSEHERECD